MEDLEKAINLLGAVMDTMETISIVGIDNQDKFVGCANAVQSAEKQIRDYIASARAKSDTAEEVTDGR